MDNPKVIHDEEQKEFRIEEEGKRPAVLKYHKKENNTVDFHNTYVPEEHRGKGVAKQLADKGYNWALENDFRITASCSYMEKYLSRKGDS